MTAEALNNHIVQALTPVLDAREAQEAARALLQDVVGIDRVALLTRPERTIEPETVERIDRAVSGITRGEPIQYVVGSAYWHGLNITVHPGVLIPRPETSELVDIICDTLGRRSGLQILDACTGSGCIAVALARELPFSRITAVDISPDALAIADENVRRLAPGQVAVEACDVLKGLPAGQFDAIVSNPPYVLESERADMEPRVLNHEPSLALFVPDDDPLRFYRAISHSARGSLKPGGYLFFEINPLQADAISKMLDQEGFEPDVIRDCHSRKRFISARLWL